MQQQQQQPRCRKTHSIHARSIAMARTGRPATKRSAVVPMCQARMAKVVLKMPIKAEFGENVAVCGSDPRLGAWDQAKAPSLTWTEGHVWTCEVELPTGVNIEYKYLINHNKTARWQTGNNTVVNIPSNALSAEVLDHWKGGHASVKITAEESAPAPQQPEARPGPQAGPPPAPVAQPSTLPQAAAASDAAAARFMAASGSSPGGQAPAPAGPARAKVLLKLPIKAEFGETVSLTGGLDKLGSWDPQRAVNMVWTNGHVWTCELDLPVGDKLEYKYFIKRIKGLEWQAGANMTLVVPQTALSAEVLDHWKGGHASVKVTAERPAVAATAPAPPVNVVPPPAAAQAPAAAPTAAAAPAPAPGRGAAAIGAPPANAVAQFAPLPDLAAAFADAVASTEPAQAAAPPVATYEEKEKEQPGRWPTEFAAAPAPDSLQADDAPTGPPIPTIKAPSQADARAAALRNQVPPSSDPLGDRYPIPLPYQKSSSNGSGSGQSGPMMANNIVPRPHMEGRLQAIGLYDSVDCQVEVLEVHGCGAGQDDSSGEDGQDGDLDGSMERMTLTELRAELRRMNLPHQGPRTMLEQRLKVAMHGRAKVHDPHLDSWTTAEVRTQLKKRGLPASGSRTQLIQRLREVGAV